MKAVRRRNTHCTICAVTLGYNGGMAEILTGLAVGSGGSLVPILLVVGAITVVAVGTYVAYKYATEDDKAVVPDVPDEKRFCAPVWTFLDWILKKKQHHNLYWGPVQKRDVWDFCHSIPCDQSPYRCERTIGDFIDAQEKWPDQVKQALKREADYDPAAPICTCASKSDIERTYKERYGMQIPDDFIRNYTQP